jgi:hypothetical protein
MGLACRLLLLPLLHLSAACGSQLLLLLQPPDPNHRHCHH